VCESLSLAANAVREGRKVQLFGFQFCFMYIL
jgi:hypothetical protein